MATISKNGIEIGNTIATPAIIIAKIIFIIE